MSVTVSSVSAAAIDTAVNSLHTQGVNVTVNYDFTREVAIVGRDVSTTSFNAQAGQTADTLATILLGAPAGGSPLTLTASSGNNLAASGGSYSGFPIGGMADGIYLSTGTQISGSPDGITSGDPGQGDPCQLNITFTTGTQDRELLLQTCMGSEEYPDYVGSQFNDTFSIKLSGPRPGGGSYDSEEIAIDNVGRSITINGGLFADGVVVGGVGGMVFNGYTPVISISRPISPSSTYSMSFSVVDVGDGIYDTAAFFTRLFAISGFLAIVTTIKDSNGNVVQTDTQYASSEGTSQTITVSTPATLADQTSFYIDVDTKEFSPVTNTYTTTRQITAQKVDIPDRTPPKYKDPAVEIKAADVFYIPAFDESEGNTKDYWINQDKTIVRV